MTRRVAGGPDPDGSGIRMLTALACALALTAAFVASCGDHHNAATPTPVHTFAGVVDIHQAQPASRGHARTPLLRPVVTATKTSRHAHTTGRTGGRAPGAVWAALAVCESSGRLHAVDTEPVAGGGTQTVVGLWQIDVKWYASAGLDPYTATRAQQYALALRIYHRQGWRAWPVCSVRIGVR